MSRKSPTVRATVEPSEMLLKVSKDRRGCVVFYLDRPLKRNALNRQLLEEFQRALTDVCESEGTRLLVLRSTSDHFSAGADLEEWAAIDGLAAFELSVLGASVCERLRKARIPTVAVLSGAVIGGGLELALSCDFRVGVPELQAGFPEVTLGNLPAWAGVANLRRTVGESRARALLLSGQLLDGREAVQLGILTHLVERPLLDETVEAMSTQLLNCDARALALVKMTLDSEMEPMLRDAAVAAYTAGLEESRERKRSFLRRRARQPQ